MTFGLRVQELSYRFGSKQALDAVSFNLEAGTFCALLGPNGAGKSTLFNLLTRLYTSPQGTIEIAGHNLLNSPLDALATLGVVFQQTTLDLDLTIRQNLSYFASLQGLTGSNKSKSIDAALDRLDLSERANEKCRSLNGGHKRRTEIARALLHKPQVLLLDEPTVGLDAHARSEITAHVHDLAQEGLTILWATHLTDEIRADDHLLILHEGQLLHDAQTQEITSGGSLKETFLDLTGRTGHGHAA